MNSGSAITVNSRKADGSVRRSWQCTLVERSDHEAVFVGEFEFNVDHPDLGFIAEGTISFEYYWPERWYNIFAFFTPDGVFRNYYCNVCMPPRFDGRVVDYVDLDIDIVVWPDWSYKVLDQEEFRVNAELFEYSDEIRKRAILTVRELEEMIRIRSLPARHGVPS